LQFIEVLQKLNYSQSKKVSGRTSVWNSSLNKITYSMYRTIIAAHAILLTTAINNPFRTLREPATNAGLKIVVATCCD
jgi:hypothetical protein